VAEDQLINLVVLKQNFEAIDLMARCDFSYNGQEALEKAVKLL